MINLLSCSHHIKTHTLPYRCTFQGCEIRKATRRDLERHLDTHEKTRLYFCPVLGCPWHVDGPKGGFSRRLDNANRHLKAHANYDGLSVLREDSEGRLFRVGGVDASVFIHQPEPSAINQVQLEESDDSDSTCSITSLDSFTPSAMASSATSISDMEPLAGDSVAEISHLISNDNQLQKLLEKAFCFIDQERVTRNFHRILRSFSQDLMHEATTLPQKQVAKFVGLKSRRIALHVRENILSSKPLTIPDHNVNSIREERLQDYLQATCPQPDSVQY
jgi:hypothetical protein